MSPASLKSLGYLCLVFTAIILSMTWFDDSSGVNVSESMDAMAHHEAKTYRKPNLDHLQHRSILMGMGALTGVIALYCLSKASRRP